MKINKAISVVISSILCGGILLTGCGGGSDVKSNTPGSTVSNSIVGEVGSFRINHLALKGIVDANNTKAFIKTQYALNIVDISNISSPEILNEYNLTLLGYSVALSSDNKLFIDDGKYLKILDATNPKALNQIGEYEASGAFADFVLSKEFLKSNRCK